MFCCIQKIEESGKGCQFSGVLDKRDFQDHVTFDFAHKNTGSCLIKVDKNSKNHTHVKKVGGGAHLKISFWHLLII